METGPFGYFPRTRQRLQEEMDRRGFRVVAGTGCGILHQPEAWAETETTFRAIAETHAAVGAEYVVHLPPLFRDDKTGEYTDDRVLSTEAWNHYIAGADRLGRLLKEDYGLKMVLHPHGDSHIETPEDIDRIFEATDPEYVGFCLDTGHIVYGGGDPVELCRKYPDRISYVHIKAMDPALVKQAHDEDWPFGLAVAKPDARCAAGRAAGHAATSSRRWPTSTRSSTWSASRTCTPVTRRTRCPTPSRPASTSPPSASASTDSGAPNHDRTHRHVSAPVAWGRPTSTASTPSSPAAGWWPVSDVDPARAAAVARGPAPRQTRTPRASSRPTSTP